MKNGLLTFCFFILIVTNLLSQQSDFPKLTGPYLGQKPPGMTPEIFAPGLISTDECYECCRAISPDGKEFFFVREIESGDKIFRMREETNGWTKPEIINYTDKDFQYSPFISPGGDKFLFMSGKSKPSQSNTDSLPEVRILNKKGNEWSAPYLIGTSIGGAQPFYITMAQNGNLYFSCKNRPGIHMSQFKDSTYDLAKKLPDEVNYLENVSHLFIAADESYIIVQSKNKEANNSLDLYISFRKKDGGWTKAINMGDKINSTDNEMCPSVSNDGKYIFLGRLIQGKKTDIYWVDAKIIEELRLKE